MADSASSLAARFVDIHGLPKLMPGKRKKMVLGAGAGVAGYAIAGMGLESHDRV